MLALSRRQAGRFATVIVAVMAVAVATVPRAFGTPAAVIASIGSATLTTTMSTSSSSPGECLPASQGAYCVSCASEEAAALAFTAPSVEATVGGGSVVPPSVAATCGGSPVNAPVIHIRLIAGTALASFQPFNEGIVIGNASGLAVLPPISGGLGDGTFSVEASWAGATAILSGAVKGALSGIVPPENPSSDVEEYSSPEDCPGEINTSSACTLLFTEEINEGRSIQGIGPLVLPSNWESLSTPQQLFVLTNLERSARGLQTITGLSEVLDASAQLGAESDSDPPAPSGLGTPAGFTSNIFDEILSHGQIGFAGSIWASGPNDLEAMFGWMYNDGDKDWGHRRIILHDSGFYACGSSCAMGAAFANSGGNGSYAEVFEAGLAPPLALNFSWSQELPNLPGCEQAGDSCSWSGIPRFSPPTRMTKTTSNAKPRGSAYTASHSSLTGVRMGRPKLSLRLSTRKGAAPIRKITISVPSIISFSTSREMLVKGIIVQLGKKKLKFTAKASHYKLTIILKTPASGFQITVKSPAITVSKALARSIDAGKRKTLKVVITATNTSHSSTLITLKLRAT